MMAVNDSSLFYCLYFCFQLTSQSLFILNTHAAFSVYASVCIGLSCINNIRPFHPKVYYKLHRNFIWSFADTDVPRARCHEMYHTLISNNS